MKVVLHYSFVTGETFYEAECDLSQDPYLKRGDTVEAIPNAWPMSVEEVNYIVEKDKKVYKIQETEERIDDENFYQKARQSTRWRVYSHQ